MAEHPIRVLIADDHAIVREGIRHVLTQTQEFQVVGEAAGGTEALGLVRKEQPEVIILDVSMPDRSGLEVTRELRTVAPRVGVLILSVHDDMEYVLEAVRAGADGYLLKDSSPSELRDAVRAVHRGEGFFSPAVARQLSAALRAESDSEDRNTLLERLTSRERDVLVLIAKGRTSKQAASELGISHRTVESHRESVVKKLGLRTVAELTRFALESGLLGS
jgi:DNA-binding NarL/FixJ family response regulator